MNGVYALLNGHIVEIDIGDGCKQTIYNLFADFRRNRLLALYRARQRNQCAGQCIL